jgi:hypothetical protein
MEEESAEKTVNPLQAATGEKSGNFELFEPE